MERGEFHALAIRDLTGQEAAVQEPVAEFLDGLADAPGLDDVNAGAEDVSGFVHPG